MHAISYQFFTGAVLHYVKEVFLKGDHMITPVTSVAALPDNGASQSAQQLAATSRAFEAMMLAQMWETAMPATMSNDTHGQAESIFRGMLLQEHANAIAQVGGIGIAALIRKGLSDA